MRRSGITKHGTLRVLTLVDKLIMLICETILPYLKNKITEMMSNDT